jgi:hypothetical protein
MTPFWQQINEVALAQGDLLPRCLVPQFEPDYGHGGADDIREVPVGEADLVIVTQTCDLANNKVTLVALCPIHTLKDFEKQNEKFKRKHSRISVLRRRFRWDKAGHGGQRQMR